MATPYRPHAWQPPPPRQKRPARVALLVILGFCALLFVGCSALVASSHDGAGAPRKVIAFNAPAHDGQFTFHVTHVGRSDHVGDTITGQDAQGEFIVVTVTVFNHGHRAQMFDASSQKLLAGGQTYDATSDPSSEAFLNDINPGNMVAANLAFDVPQGTRADQVVLHDSPFSNGVRVALK